MALAVLFGALGVRSYWILEHVWRYDANGTGGGISSNCGTIHINIYRNRVLDMQSGTYYYRTKLNSEYRKNFNASMFFVHIDHNRAALRFPHWFLALIFAAIPIVFFWRSRRRKSRGFEVALAVAPKK